MTTPRLALAAVLALAWSGCGPPDISRLSQNPRKDKIYGGVFNFIEADKSANVGSIGPMGAPRSHPLRLKSPYATRADLEAAMGPSDKSEMQKVSYIVEGGMGAEAEEDNLAVIWWEKDSTWETYGAGGTQKPGYREVVTAWFDKEGKLKKVIIVHPVGTEIIERHSSLWKWYG